MRCKQEGAGVRQQDSSEYDAGPNPAQEGGKNKEGRKGRDPDCGTGLRKSSEDCPGVLSPKHVRIHISVK